ncbi:TetR/AcrR family transcriptional regulator [Tistrella mobilis]|jgi:AcrR family transcriptional regulator|uniref:TetR/AcrR family transcriptional regulator n=1 Tax=Tistrella mobilis TaxID=171437 RepID=UPI003558182C
MTDASAVRPSLRDRQRDQTRQRLLDAAVTSLIECGVARTTTLEVQRRAGASRGALLHHFPSHAALLSATIGELVRRNDAAVSRAVAHHEPGTSPVARAIRSLVEMSSQPAFMAELELWAAARTDPDLQAAIRAAERDARSDRERVVSALFAPVADRPNYAVVVEMTIQFLRGLAVSRQISRRPEAERDLVARWIWAAETLLSAPPPEG